MKPIDTFRTLLFSVCLVLIGGPSEAVAQEATDSVAPAIRQDEAGKNYIDILYAGLVETKSVDILYREGDLCLVEAAALPAGSRVIVPKEG